MQSIAIEMENLPDLDEVIAAVPEMEEQLIDALQTIHDASMTFTGPRAADIAVEAHLHYCRNNRQPAVNDMTPDGSQTHNVRD